MQHSTHHYQILDVLSSFQSNQCSEKFGGAFGAAHIGYLSALISVSRPSSPPTEYFSLQPCVYSRIVIKSLKHLYKVLLYIHVEGIDLIFLILLVSLTSDQDHILQAVGCGLRVQAFNVLDEIEGEGGKNLKKSDEEIPEYTLTLKH